MLILTGHKAKQSKICLLGVGMCLYSIAQLSQLVQTKNKQWTNMYNNVVYRVIYTVYTNKQSGAE